MEDKKILDFISDYLKSNKVSYQIDGELIRLYTGSYEGFIQLEGHSGFEEDDYNTMQTWITNDNRFSHELYHESSSYSLDISECEEMLAQLITACKEVNNGVAKLLYLINDVQTILDDYKISSIYFLNMAEEKLK